MDKAEISYGYFEWIASSLLVTKVENVNNPVRVLDILHSIQFVVRHRDDTNRVFDGEDLRYRFGNVENIPDAVIAATIDSRPCSVLEMMAALSLRAGENVFGYPIVKEGATWLFWEMCRNLDILDDKNSLMGIKEKVKAFLERDYRDDGRGNIFSFPGIDKDIRKAEIWNQAMVYINYHYDDFLKAAKIMPQ